MAIRTRLQIGWFAHVARSTKVAWEHAVRIIPASAILKKNETDKILTLINGSRLTFGSLDEPDYVLGAGFDIIVIDEGARVTKYARDEILAPMAADRNGLILVITTPKGKKGKGGWVWRDYQKAAQGVPGYYKMTGPTTQNPLPAIKEWARWAKANLPGDVYRQEILAQFLDYGGTVLDLSGIATMGGNEDHPIRLPFVEGPELYCKLEDRSVVTEPCSTGIDLADTVNYTVVASIGMNSGRLKYMDRFHRIGWHPAVQRIKRGLQGRRGLVRVDATGLGGPVCAMLRKANVAFKPVTFNPEVKTSLVQGLQVATEQREFATPWIAEMIAEGESFEGDVLTSGRMKYGAADGFHDDIIIALALAVQGIQNRITGVPT